MSATVTEIALKAGLSKGLVSRVLRGDETLRVSESRRQQVLDIAEQLGGVQRSVSGRAVGPRLTRNIVIPVNRAAVMQELMAHWENNAFASLKVLLAEHGFRLSVELYESDSPLAIEATYRNLQGKCDGLLLLGNIVTPDVATFILDNDIPHVGADPVARFLGLNTVTIDYGGAQYAAIDHLRQLGHTRIGYLGRTQHDKYATFVAAMAYHELDFEPAWRCQSPKEGRTIPRKEPGWRDAAREAFGPWFTEARHGVTAIYCHNDYGAWGVCDVLKKLGIEPGRDFSVVGSGDFPVPRDAAPLTTIGTSLADLGRGIGEVLIDQIVYKRRRVVHRLIPSVFIPRATTGACPVD